MQSLQIQIHILGHFTVQYTILPLSHLWGENVTTVFSRGAFSQKREEEQGKYDLTELYLQLAAQLLTRDVF
jgi:hypothetical protein